MSTISIRNMTTEDQQECGELFLQIFGPNGCGESWTLETSIAHIQEGSFDTEFCFVAESEGKIIGLVTAFPTSRESGKDLYIETIGVISSRQGEHIGSDLYAKVTELAQQKGFQHVRLLANAQFLSYEWYKKMGMQESGWVEMVKPL